MSEENLRKARKWCADDSAISLQRSADFIRWLDTNEGSNPGVPFDVRAHSLAALLDDVRKAAHEEALEAVLFHHDVPDFRLAAIREYLASEKDPES